MITTALLRRVIYQFHVLFGKPFALHLDLREGTFDLTQITLRKFDFSRSEIFLKARPSSSGESFLRFVLQAW